ncbi:TolC family protein [Flavobacterium frigoris]|uniref:Outer membrane efflux protein n=1 Tax=Flavobacterium frigoris TaxID=229204 RepID=A0A1H9CD17_FLAFI|nr:TolC family protein [Flavobacterium frigoris]SEP99044.1 Outer membrane efflux protein [Flavobacterium frigoris]
MKNTLKIILILTVTVFSFDVAQAQSTDFENKDEISLPSLQVVIDSVLNRNAMLKFRKQHIGVKESTLASERIYWTRNFGVQADTKYGNLNNFSTNADAQGNTSVLTTSSQFNYSVGLYAKIPIFDFLNRKHQVGLARLELDEAKSMAQFQEDEIRQTVIKMYQDLILKQKILKIKSKTLGDGKVNMQMVEKEFRNGIVPVAEYVRITSIASTVEVDYEFAKSEFTTAKKLLEDMAGFTFYK